MNNTMTNNCPRCSALEAERDDWIACHAKIFRELQETKTLLGNKCAECDREHSLFIAAIRDLAAINEALNLDPDDGGAVPIIDAIEELKATIAQQAEQLAAAQKVIDAAGNLIAQKGRHNTEIAYKRLAKAIAAQKEGK